MRDHSFAAAAVIFHVAVRNNRSCRAVDDPGAICTHAALIAMAGIEVRYRYYRLERDVWQGRDHRFRTVWHVQLADWRAVQVTISLDVGSYPYTSDLLAPEYRTTRSSRWTGR
jgi:hypothetical protein